MNTIKKRKLNEYLIPDISYQLVFCFLSLQQLPLIAQCSKEWKRLVTVPPFLNLFSNNNNKMHHKIVLQSDKERKLESLSKSSFRSIIHEIKLIDFSYETIFLVEFNRLESLTLEINWTKCNQFNISPVFEALGPRLTELNVNMKLYVLTSSLIQDFQNALSFLTSLVSLKFITNDCVKIFQNISFLSRMKQLKSLCCDCIQEIVLMKHMVDYLGALENLTHLELCDFFYFDFSSFEVQFKELVNGLKHLKLKHLGSFYIPPQHKQIKFAQLLNQFFPYLETIDVRIGQQSNIPGFIFDKWIHHLQINNRYLEEQDVQEIKSLSNLKSFKLYNFGIEKVNMSYLIDGLSSRLEILDLHVYNYYDWRISFRSISRYTKLKSLSLFDVLSVDDKEFELLTNCKQLESISIQYYRRATLNTIKLDTLGPIMQKALSIHSFDFPMLQKINISKS
jgi:hypothetical protein